MNVKPGDLAIVIGVSNTPENIGKLVEVLRYACSGEIFSPINGSSGYKLVPTIPAPIVVMRSMSGDPILWRATNGREEYFSEVPIFASYLRPVSGLPDTEDTNTEQPIKETA